MRVPVIDRQVGPAPVPGVRLQPAEAVGAGEQMLGQALDRVGQMVVQRARELKERDDKTRAMELYNDFARRRQDYLYGDNGVMRLSGPAVRDAYTRALSDFDNMREEYLGMADNDDQRFYLQSMLDNDIQQSTEKISIYEAGEQQKLVDDTFKRTLAQAENDVALAAGDPAQFDASLRLVEQALILRYNLDPENPEHTSFLSQQLQVARENLHLVALDSMIKAGNYRAAQAWFDAHKEEIPGDRVGDVAQAIREGMKYVNLQEKGAGIVAQYDWRKAKEGREYIRANFESAEEENLLAYCEKLWDEDKEAYQQELKKRVRTQADVLALRFSYHNPKACYDYIRNSDEYEEDIKEPLVQEMEKRFREDESTFLQIQSDTYDAAIEQITAAKSFRAAEDIITRTGLKQELKDRLTEYAADKFNIDLNYPGAPARTDMKTFWAILETAGRTDPKTGRSALLTECPTWQKFLDKYGGKLSIPDQRQMRSLYESMVAGAYKKKSEREVDLAFSRVSMLNRLLKEAGITDPVEIGEAWKYIYTVVGTIEAQAGKELDPEEFTKWAKWSLEKVVVKKNTFLWFDQRARRYDIQLPPGAWFDPKLNAWLYKGTDGKTYKVVFE